MFICCCTSWTRSDSHSQKYSVLLVCIKTTHFFCLKVVHRFLYDPDSKHAVCKDATAASFPFPGVFLWENFISEEEEKKLISAMDQEVWNESQSGRRKQVMCFEGIRCGPLVIVVLCQKRYFNFFIVIKKRSSKVLLENGTLLKKITKTFLLFVAGLWP